jgi:hypothetical protein
VQLPSTVVPLPVPAAALPIEDVAVEETPVVRP